MWARALRFAVLRCVKQEIQFSACVCVCGCVCIFVNKVEWLSKGIFEVFRAFSRLVIYSCRYCHRLCWTIFIAVVYLNLRACVCVCVCVFVDDYMLVRMKNVCAYSHVKKTLPEILSSLLHDAHAFSWCMLMFIFFRSLFIFLLLPFGNVLLCMNSTAQHRKSNDNGILLRWNLRWMCVASQQYEHNHHHHHRHYHN